MLSFKTWIENTAALKVALVGWSGTPTDKNFRTAVGNFLKKDSHMAKLWPHAHFDRINLNDGRDFLQESRPYDVVLLCWVTAGDTHKGDQGHYNVSKDHTPAGWKSRLVASRAKYIFASGAGTEVAHEFLGNLDGYVDKPIGTHITAYIHRNLYH
jgi:hypothetical protein